MAQGAKLWVPLDMNGKQITNGAAAVNPTDIPIFSQVPGAAAVSSVFARTGAVVAVSGDYTAAQVGALAATAAAGGDLSGNYPNPAVAKVNGTSLPATPAVGQVPTATSTTTATWQYPPGYEIGYDQITGNVTVSSATEATGTAVITASAHTFDGGAVIAEFYAAAILTGATNDFVIACLFESTTEIGRITAVQGTSIVQGGYGRIRFTPSAGSHTYKITAFRNANNGTIFAGAGGTAAYAPSFLRFTKA